MKAADKQRHSPGRSTILVLGLLVFSGVGLFWWFSPSHHLQQLREQSTSELIVYTAKRPTDSLALVELASRFERQKLFTEAIRTYMQAGRADVGKARYWLEAVRLAIHSGDREAALEAVAGALQAEPNHAGALTMQGEIAAKDGEWQVAYTAFQSAIKANKNQAQAQDGFARAAIELRRWTEARDAAKEATRLEPSNPGYWRILARAERLAGNPNAACKATDEGLRSAPNDPTLLLESGLARMQTSPPELTQAKIALAHASQLWQGYPQASDALTALGLIHLKQNNLVNAESVFRFAWQTVPTNLDALYGLSQTLQLMGKSAEAKRLMTEYSSRRTRELAIGHLQMRVGRDSNRADLWGRLGDLYFAQEAWTNALAAYERSLQLAPTQQGLHARIAEIKNRRTR